MYENDCMISGQTIQEIILCPSVVTFCLHFENLFQIQQVLQHPDLKLSEDFVS
jgi:hypothetical protein